MIHRSRKFSLTLIGLVLIVLGPLYISPVIYMTYCSGIIGVLAFYFGANVGNKFAVGKVNQLTLPPQKHIINED